MNISPSQITLKRLPFYEELYESSLPFLEEGYDYPVFAENTVNGLVNKVKHFYGENYKLWLIQVEDKIAGIFAIGLFPEPIKGADSWYETVIYVHKQFRKQGLAKILTASAAQSFKKKQWEGFMVEVRTDNPVSIATHSRIFPEIAPVEVVYSSYTTLRWLLPVKHSYTINGSHKWLAEKIGSGLLPKFRKISI